MIPFHHFLYGASRTGKTTFAAQCAKAGMKTLAITMEPGVTQTAFAAEGAEVAIHVPSSDIALYLLLDYPDAYLEKHLGGLKPDLGLFDNLQGLQHLIIGRPGEPEKVVEGMKILRREATGIVGRIPKGAGDISNPEALSQAQYGVLGRYTRRLFNGIDQLPFSTIITTTEQYDFDEKYKKDVSGRKPNEAAGRPRRVMGWPATEGNMAKQMYQSCVSGAVLHLTKEVDRGGKGVYTMYTQPHTDSDNVEWFADPRGLGNATSPIVWTGKSAPDLLNLLPKA